MGTTSSSTSSLPRTSTTSPDHHGGSKSILREHKRHGLVTVKIANVNNNRRDNLGQINHIISPKGAILYGTLFNPNIIQKGKCFVS